MVVVFSHSHRDYMVATVISDIHSSCIITIVFLIVTMVALKRLFSRYTMVVWWLLCHKSWPKKLTINTIERETVNSKMVSWLWRNWRRKNLHFLHHRSHAFSPQGNRARWRSLVICFRPRRMCSWRTPGTEAELFVIYIPLAKVRR